MTSSTLSCSLISEPAPSTCISRDLMLHRFAELDAQDENGWTALHYGAMTNAFKCVRFLVAEGADMSLKDLNKRRALHLARFKEHGETIAALSQQVRLG